MRATWRRATPCSAAASPLAAEVSPIGSFTDPEYASVGLTEAAAREKHDVIVAIERFDSLPRPIIDGRPTGFCKLIVDRRLHTILGCHIVGERAVELAQLAAIAMSCGMKVGAARPRPVLVPHLRERDRARSGHSRPQARGACRPGPTMTSRSSALVHAMPADADPRRRRHVVIVGGGFGGLAAARKLRRADVEVTLVDRRNHQLFQPLLYQVAAGGLASGECAYPIRVALRRASNTRVLLAEATDIDVERRELMLDRGERLEYDSLIVACGAETSYFGNDEWRDVSCGLKTLDDAVELRNRFYGALEEAERASEERERQEWMTFVVIGGGPTGVEISGQLGIITGRSMTREYVNVDPREVRIILLDAGERLVAAFAEGLSEKVAEQLSALGVTIRERARATAIDAHGVTIEVEGGTEHLAARTVIWAAGVRPVPFAATLAKATRASTDSAGCVQIEPNLTIPGYPEISAIGDIAAPGGSGRQGAARARDGRHPTGAPRGRGDPQRSPGRVDAVSLLRQGLAGGGRSRQGRVRNPRVQALRSSRILRLPDGPPLLSRGRTRAPAEGAHRLDRCPPGLPPEPGDRGRAEVIDGAVKLAGSGRTFVAKDHPNACCPVSLRSNRQQDVGVVMRAVQQGDRAASLFSEHRYRGG